MGEPVRLPGMERDGIRHFETPREDALGLQRLTNVAGLSLAVLPNGCLFAIELARHRRL